MNGVVPANAGIRFPLLAFEASRWKIKMDSRLRGNDGDNGGAAAIRVAACAAY
jgi:hypothetical protein